MQLDSMIENKNKVVNWTKQGNAISLLSAWIGGREVFMLAFNVICLEVVGKTREKDHVLEVRV
jgi:hypothetical protein